MTNSGLLPGAGWSNMAVLRQLKQGKNIDFCYTLLLL
jgi:hypothetical protein